MKRAAPGQSKLPGIMPDRAELEAVYEAREIVEPLELRAAPEGSTSPGTIVGYAAVFNRYSLDLGFFREKVAPGAFTDALKRCDVRCLRNHEPESILGRTSAGTLRLVQDEIGLRIECDLPNTQIGRDTAESIGRGDIQGQSFAFSTAIDQWDYSSEPWQRTVVEIAELYDVGPVTFPAYEDTSVAVRSYAAARAKREAPSAPPDPPTPPLHLIEIEHDTARLRLLEASTL
jgi:HK97 family phage prohead protease